MLAAASVPAPELQQARPRLESEQRRERFALGGPGCGLGISTAGRRLCKLAAAGRRRTPGIIGTGDTEGGGRQGGGMVPWRGGGILPCRASRVPTTPRSRPAALKTAIEAQHTAAE